MFPIGFNRGGGIVWWVKQLFQCGISCVAVPFFFFMAGYFLAGHVEEAGWWRRELRKRWVTLVIPFFVWDVLWGLYSVPLTVLANYYSGEPLALGLPQGVGAWIGVFGLHPFYVPILFTLWFVRCLFLLMVLSPLLVAVVRRGWVWGWGLAGVFLLCQMAVNLWCPKVAPWNNLAIFFFPLFSVVCFVVGLTVRLWRTKAWYGSAWVGVITLVSVESIIVLQSNHILDRWLTQSVWACLQPVLRLVGGWALWQIVPTRPWPTWLISCAFPVYLMHLFVVKFWFGLQGQFGVIADFASTLVGYLTFWGTSVFVSVGITLCLHRWFPRLAGVLFGNR